ncbi:uncharacterized protein LOC100123504 isoform X2 [Nasonia vitripennis]|nr:uncharacterized protein LOC100123504 isoform X2 [Nasonia vitripennis]XP_031787025.1 uncharacterized protein LOC100123504 isoform X2 [Nasonia vitripennis]XP_031787026.1 uncharacterized protein LOC100123504 isoform X2 [Nasonia vitripennis]
MRRRTSPVQQWVDSLPSPAKSTASSLGSIIRQQSVSVDSESASIPECTVEQAYSEKENFISHSNMTVSTPITVPSSPAITYHGRNVSRLARDPSFQSDSSHCSSVESLLELRRADPEAVLLSLGFGGCAGSPQENGPLSRIPKRFLQPSRLKGIAINDFVRHQQEASESLDSTSLGYRGLTGSPYVAPSEIVQKIMQRLREHESHEFDAYASYNNNAEPYMLPQQQEGRLSVLSPDNRQFLERPRSKSPDMRNKRMIIGQRSFAFGRDGDLIEINPRSTQSSVESDDVFVYLDDLSPDTPSTMNQLGPTVYSENFETSNYPKEPNNSFLHKHNKPRLIDLRSNPSKENRDSIETVIPVNINNNYLSTATINVATDKNHNESSEAASPRRASEGSNAKSSLQDQEEGRRHSDTVMHSMKKSDDELCRKRNLRRQAKFRDEDTVAEVEEDVSSRATSLRLSDESPRCSHCGKPERSHDDEEEAGVSCCYKGTSQNCWREMEKVLQKNKKLEDVVNKSRREMAEIRDMLSSVLSVRMEPGF